MTHRPVSLFVLLFAGVLFAETATAVPDHLQCYKIKDSLAKTVFTATLTPTDSSFPVAAGCEISVPAKLLCVDSTKSAVNPVPPGADDGIPAQQYLCYKTKCPKSEVTGSAVDQFGTHSLTIKSTSLACAPLVLPIHCYDGELSGDETDVDCGGSCQVCGISSTCENNSDCAIGNCAAATCSFPSCSDTMLNGSETDVDCGGSCAGCAGGLDCSEAGDCASGFCSAGTCSPCAGNTDCQPEGYCSSGACLPLVGAACSTGATCPSGFCVDGVCCDTACSSTCEACSFAKKQSGTSGTCGPIAIGTDPDSECPGTNVCAGTCQPVLTIAQSNAAIPRNDSCADALGRSCESVIGDVLADAMAATQGTDFAILNSGGIRADLTCPAGGNASCDPYSPPPHAITTGELLSVLPFANRLVATTVTGDVLKYMLENAVSLAPASAGRFPQLSGLCVTYDIAKPAGSRVLSAVRTALNGTCTGAAVDLSVTGSYSVALNEFAAGGGDGYPNLLYASTFGDTDFAETLQYLTSATPLSPALGGRIVCTDSNGATAPNCAP